jgi:hypothetical protein
VRSGSLSNGFRDRGYLQELPLIELAEKPYPLGVTSNSYGVVQAFMTFGVDIDPTNKLNCIDTT